MIFVVNKRLIVYNLKFEDSLVSAFDSRIIGIGELLVRVARVKFLLTISPRATCDDYVYTDYFGNIVSRCYETAEHDWAYKEGYIVEFNETSS